MVEEAEIQEPELQQEPDPPKKKLWKSLTDKHLYTKSYDDFGKQFSTPESIDKLHKVLTDKELYTKTTDDFKSQFFSDLTPTVKKKVASVDLAGSSLEAGNVLAQSNGEDGTESPMIEMYNLPNGELVPKDEISLAKKYKELNERGTRQRMGGEGAVDRFIPDEDARNSAKKLAEDFKDIDLQGIYDETKDLSEGVIANHGKRLIKERNENPQLYQRDMANLKWRSGLEQSLAAQVETGALKRDEYDNLLHEINQLPLSAAQGDYTNQRATIKSLSKSIQLFGGENKDQILKDFAIEASKVYGNPDNKPTGVFKDTPESKYFNEDAQLGYQYLQDIAPDKAKQYERLLIDPKTLKDKSDEQKGYNHLMQTLEETGIGLQQNSVNEELNNLKNIAQRNNGLTPEQIDKATELEKKQEELSQKTNELDKKYPDRLVSKVDDAMQEIFGQKLSFGEYAIGKTLEAAKSTGEGIWEAVSTPFMSKENTNMRELAIMGDQLGAEKLFHKTDKNKNLLTDELIIEPDLQAKIDAIKNDNNISDTQKKSIIKEYLQNNTDKFGRVPIQNGKFNINPSSILYGVTDLGTALLPFIGVEAATGGIGGTGAAAKFLRTFTAAAATTFHDEYANALMEGKTQSDAYRSAMSSTAINSMAMAGAGTPADIRKMAGEMKTSASKIIAQMSDKEIQNVLSKGTPKGLKAFGQSFKERAKAIPSMVGEGLKTGAKFEAYMTGANLLNDREVNFKQSLLNIANFGILGAGLGQIGYKSPTELQKSGLLKMGENPEEFHLVAQEMKKEGQLSPSEFDHRKDLIEKAGEAYKTLPKSLDEKQKSEYLYQTVIKNEATKGKSDLPPKQASEAEHTALVADYKREIIIDEPTDKQLESRKNTLEKQLEQKDEEGKLLLDDKERAKAKAQLEAINDAIENNKSVKVADDRAKELLEKNKPEPQKREEAGIVVEEPQIIPEPIMPKDEETKTEIPDTETKGSDTALDNGENIPPTEEGEEKVTGVKRAITDPTRAENNMPKVDFPKMTSDFDALNEAKQRVDNGEVNPQEMVDRILKEKGNYKNEAEVMDMQYYAHQLEKKNQELTTKLSEAKTPEEEADIRSQKLQLSDLMDAQTEAAQTAGNQWGKTGNRMQPVINDAGQIFRENKSTIKEAYGGEVPKDVQEKLDALTKERDDAIAAKAKVEEELRQKMAAKGFEEVKKSAERQSKRKQSKEELKKEEEDLLTQLNDEIKGDPNAPKRSGLPITDKMVVIVGKLAVNYAKQGIKAIEEVVDKIYTQVKAQGYTKQQVQEMLAQFNETERLNKKAEILENKLTPPSVNSKGKPTQKPDLTKPSKVYETYKKSTEWVKANQRVSNAEFKMKIEKRKAFESQKNWFQRGLAWAGRLTRLSVLSGYNVLGKLAAAATIGSAAKRPVEQIIGSIYSQAFKGIAQKAPIEGFLNAKSEAKWYKEFFNPKKFVKNSWEILKTGSSDLGKRLGSAEYEHVPVLYLPTDLHQIIKDPPKRATFEASFRNGLIWAEKNGLDINDPLVINSIENAAYKRAQYEIFQEQNWLSKKFTSYKSALEKKGNIGSATKFLVDFMIPVSTVPTNIVRRIVTTSPLGLIRGGKEVIQAYRKGIESLKPEEADHVMQQLKQGSLGTALWLIGWYGASQFGGLYSKYNPDKKRKEGELAHDEMSVGGKMIPKPAQHALPLEIIQFAATARHVYDNYVDNKDASKPQAIYAAGLSSIGALLEQIPTIETGVHLVNAAGNPYEGEKLKEDITRRFEPQILRETGVIQKEEKSTEKPTKKPKTKKPQKTN